jgi:hypothetical protein
VTFLVARCRDVLATDPAGKAARIGLVRDRRARGSDNSTPAGGFENHVRNHSACTRSGSSDASCGRNGIH